MQKEEVRTKIELRGLGALDIEERHIVHGTGTIMDRRKVLVLRGIGVRNSMSTCESCAGDAAGITEQ